MRFMVFSSIFNLYFIDRDMYLAMFTFVIESTLTFKWVVDYARNGVFPEKLSTGGNPFRHGYVNRFTEIVFGIANRRFLSKTTAFSSHIEST
jgi:hypothetical protein